VTAKYVDSNAAALSYYSHIKICRVKYMLIIYLLISAILLTKYYLVSPKLFVMYVHKDVNNSLASKTVMNYTYNIPRVAV